MSTYIIMSWVDMQACMHARTHTHAHTHTRTHTLVHIHTTHTHTSAFKDKINFKKSDTHQLADA